MEIMTKEEYLEKIAETLLDTIRTLDIRVNMLTTDDRDQATRRTESDIIYWLKLAGHDGQIEAVGQNDFDTAYDAYCEENEQKDHIYDVDFSFTVSGKAQVHAEDQDEAENYVDENLRIEPEVSFYEDDKVVTDVEINDWDEEREYDVTDTGDEYED